MQSSWMALRLLVRHKVLHISIGHVQSQSGRLHKPSFARVTTLPKAFHGDDLTVVDPDEEMSV
jgi:hypothetical protein